MGKVIRMTPLNMNHHVKDAQDFKELQYNNY